MKEQNLIMTKEKVLNKYTLFFKNPKLESEYSQRNHKSRRNLNIGLSLVCLLFSIAILTGVEVLNVKVHKEMKERGVQIHNVRYLKNVEDQRVKENTFYKEYVVMSEGQVSSEHSINSSTVRRYLFVKLGLPLILGTCFIYLLLFLLSYFCYNNDKTQRVAFCFIFFFFGINFHIISGILRSFYKLTSDPLFFVVAFKMLFKISIIFQAKVLWLQILTFSSLSILFEWSIFILIHYRMNSTILFYFSVNTLIHVCCIILSYYNEFNSKYKFFLLRNLNFEKEYLINFIYSMEQGFLTYSNKKILFMNKAMNKIVNELLWLVHDEQPESRECEEDEESVDYEQEPTNNNTDVSGIEEEEHSPKNDIEKNPPEILKSNPLRGPFEVQITSPTSKKVKKTFKKSRKAVHDETTKFLHSDVIDTNFKSNSHIIIEKFFENMIGINHDLPSEIIEVFMNKSNFKLEKLYNLIKNNKKFLDFQNLGIIEIKSQYESSLAFYSNPQGSKTYQISFRMVTYEDSDQYLEMMISDITQRVNYEKAIRNSRSVYISKVAHELKNPLSSLIDLSVSAKEEFQEDPSNIQTDRVYYNAEYTEKVCSSMLQFIKDFSNFTSLKFSCEKCYTAHSNKCPVCKLNTLCPMCSVCRNCETNQYISFDFSSVINNTIEIFKSLNFFERGEEGLQFNYSNNCETNIIKTNNKLFTSMIYNLLNHAYKFSNKDDIYIDVSYNKNKKNEILFSIEHKGIEIDKNFIHNLKWNEVHEDYNIKKDNFENDKFNKYFNLYLAFYFAMKIKTNLNIESSKNYSKYSFVIKHNVEEINSIQKNSHSMVVNNPPIKSVVQHKKKTVESKVSSKSLNSSSGRCLTEPTYSTCSTHSNQEEKVFIFLIVDDEILVRNILIRHLKKISEKNPEFKFETYEANNCYEALDAIHNLYTNSNLIFDFLIIDEQMPLMNGSTLIKLLRELEAQNYMYPMQIISHTAFDSIQKTNMIIESGADNILSKPVHLQEFKDLLCNSLKVKLF
jgi:CheY-like chemotaxis protein